MGAIIIKTFEGNNKAIAIRNNRNVHLYEQIKNIAINEYLNNPDQTKMNVCRVVSLKCKLSINTVYRVLTYIYELKY